MDKLTIYILTKQPIIEKLENLNEKYLIFLRPRRFGKSLFLSTLQYYYDENLVHEFDALFHDTYIGKNPTPLKSSYRILFFEFSGINIDAGMEEIYQRFTFKTRISLSVRFVGLNKKLSLRIIVKRCFIKGKRSIKNEKIIEGDYLCWAEFVVSGLSGVLFEL